LLPRIQSLPNPDPLLAIALRGRRVPTLLVAAISWPQIDLKGTHRTFSDLQTKQARPIFALEKPSPGWIGGMPVSDDGNWLLFPQKDERSSELMLIENWR
jgi:hypothetical protein